MHVVSKLCEYTVHVWWRTADTTDFGLTHARLALLDWLVPMPRTLTDEIRERDRERLRKAFPKVDIDGTGPKSG
jgi:hypothetical protein